MSQSSVSLDVNHAAKNENFPRFIEFGMFQNQGKPIN